MNPRRATLVLLCLVCAALQWGCATEAFPEAAQDTAPAAAAQEPAFTDLASAYAPLRSEPGHVMQLHPESSQVRIYAFRAGRAANLGHNHVLSAPVFEGYFYWPDSDAAQARFDLVLRLDQLAFDRAEQRAEISAEGGAAFASHLSDAAIEATREHMLGPDNMQADAYPLVRIHSLRIAGESPKFAALLAVEIHGQTREIWVPLSVSGLPTQVKASGALVLRQSAFGVQPYSILGGLLSVQDELLVEFTLVGD